MTAPSVEAASVSSAPASATELALPASPAPLASAAPASGIATHAPSTQLASAPHSPQEPPQPSSPHECSPQTDVHPHLGGAASDQSLSHPIPYEPELGRRVRPPGPSSSKT